MKKSARKRAGTLPEHPMQPVIQDARGVLRFHRNAIVRHLLDHGGIDLNQIALLNFSREDQEHFAQLIGYSISGYHDLNYVSDKSAARASVRARKIMKDHGPTRSAKGK